MVHNEALHLILTSLLRRDLGEAITATDNFLAIHPHQVNTDRLFAIRTDYQLMTDYWRRGFKDPQLPNLYTVSTAKIAVRACQIAEQCTVRAVYMDVAVGGERRIQRISLFDHASAFASKELEFFFEAFLQTSPDDAGSGGH